MIKQKEASLHQQIVDYLKLQYPKVLFRTDFSAGIKMTIGQAMKHKALQKCKAWPDLHIVKPSKGYYGLFLELKKEGTKITNRNGEYATPHLKDQAEILATLKELGYAGSFAVGFDETKAIIDDYLKP